MIKKKEVIIEDFPVSPPKEASEKEILLELYQVLQDRHINSISDLENLIARS